VATREEKIKLDVTGADKSARDLELVGGTAKRVGDAVEEMGRDADKASRKVDDLGDEARQTAGQLDKLEREVVQAKVALKALGDEYARTTDPKVGAELDKQAAALGKLEARAKSIAKINKDLGGGQVKAVDPIKAIQLQITEMDRAASVRKRIAADEAAAHKEAEQRAKQAERDSFLRRRDERPVRTALKDLFGILPGLGSSGAGAGASGASTLSSLTNAGGPIFSTISTLALGAAAGSAAIPALAAAGGAATGLGAFGVVGGGIAGAAMQSSHVGDAFNKELDGVESRFKKATYSWVGPTIDAIHTIGDAVKGIPLEDIFKNAQKYVQPLAKGVGGFLSGIGTGVDALVKQAGPVVDMLSKKLPQLGKDIGDSLSLLGKGGKGGAEALGDVIDLVGDLTKGFSAAAAGAGELYGKLINTPVFKQGHDLFKSLTDFKDLPETAARQLHGMAAAEDELGASAAEAAQHVKDLDDAIQGHIDKALGAIDANIAWEQSHDALVEGFKRSKDALDISNDTGRKNVGLAKDMIEAAKQVRQAAIDQGDGSALASAKANIAYQNQLNSIEDLLVSMGVARDQAHAFIQQFQAIDGKTFKASVKVDVSYQGYNPGIALGNLLHHAGGRSASAPEGWAVVGENGPELAYFNQGDRVWSTQQSHSMMGAADQGRARAASSMPSYGGGGGGVPWPSDSALKQAVAALVVQLMQDGKLPVPASAIR
jgi:hypothetical protein